MAINIWSRFQAWRRGRKERYLDEVGSMSAADRDASQRSRDSDVQNHRPNQDTSIWPR